MVQLAPGAPQLAFLCVEIQTNAFHDFDYVLEHFFEEEVRVVPRAKLFPELAGILANPEIYRDETAERRIAEQFVLHQEMEESYEPFYGALRDPQSTLSDRFWGDLKSPFKFEFK